MKRKVIGAVAAGVSLGAFAGSAFGVGRNDNTVGTPLSEPGSVMITGSGYIGSGTVVGNGQWVLTAGHVAASMGGVGGTCTITPMNVGGTGPNNAAALTGTFQSVTNNSGNNALITGDWSLIKLPSALPGAIQLAAANPAVGDTITFVGWGLSDPAAGSGNAGSVPQVPRQARNVVNLINGPKDFMGFDFDLTGGAAASPNLTISNGINFVDAAARDGLGVSEGTTFGGDSGMGYLETINGTLQLVGIHDGIVIPPYAQAGVAGLNKDQVESYGTPVGSFGPGILTMIPEPSTFTLLGLCSVGLLRRARRR